MFRRISTILGVFAGLSMVIAAMWSWHDAAQLAQNATRPDVTAWAVKSAAVALGAAAQALFVTFIVSIIYRRDLFADVLRIFAALVAGIALISCPWPWGWRADKYLLGMSRCPSGIAATLLIGLSLFPNIARADQPASTPAAPAATAPAAAPDAAATTQPIDPIGDAALAERLTQMAQASLAFRAINQTTFKEAASLVKAASLLAPDNPRFPRLLSEAYLQLGDHAGAIDALKKVAGIDPGDQVALIGLLDLYAGQMQSADAKLGYYQQKLGLTSLAAPVRAHIAYRCAQLMLDRGQNSEAKDMIAQAMKLNPVDPDALEMNEKFTRDGKPEEHVNALLQLLLSNPAQPAVMTELASELADQGLTSESAGWYANSVSVTNRVGMSADPQKYADYLAEVVIAGQAKGGATIVDSLLGADPNNVTGLYLKLLVTRRGTDADATAKALDDATNGFCENIYQAYRHATKNDPPSTQATGDVKARLGDVDALAKQVATSKDPIGIAHLGSSLTDLAWLEIYFAQKPADAAPLIAALHSVLPADDVRFSRLEGWSLLMSKKPDEAKVKLSAVADRDPLSAMGVIRILAAQPAQKDAATKQAKQLVDQNPSGLLCVMLMDGLKDQGVTGVDISPSGEVIKKALAQFPKQIFDVLDKPETFYQIDCEPGRVGHAYDDPMLAIVKLMNVSPVPLTIGAKGVIHPDLWFDVQLRGLEQQNLTGIAYDRIARRTVLQPGESTEQVVRLDQAKLAQVLAGNPLIAMQLSFTIVTNPTSSATGIIPGAAGQRELIRKFLVREANPLNAQNEAQIQQVLAAGSGDMKIRTVSLVATYAKALLANSDAQMQTRGKQIISSLSDMSGDPSPSVAAWAQYESAMARPADQRPAILKQMVQSDYWATRMLGASLAMGIPGAPSKEAFDTLKTDADPLVKSYAEACEYDAAHPTTKPTTQDSSAVMPAYAVPGAASQPSQ